MEDKHSDVRFLSSFNHDSVQLILIHCVLLSVSLQFDGGVSNAGPKVTLLSDTET